VVATLGRHGLDGRIVARPNAEDVVSLERGNTSLFRASRVDLQRAWSETTWQLQSLRDNPVCAQQEYDRILDAGDPGLSPQLTFDPAADVAAPYVSRGARPPIAILREQGVNGQVEMAAAFDRAGFAARDVHMSDIIAAGCRSRSFSASRPVEASRTGTCWVAERAGRNRSSTIRGRGMSLPPSSPAATASRWASATAAR